MMLKTIFLPWLRVAELSIEAKWLLEGWNRACVINDSVRDALERAYDRNRELADELGRLRQAEPSEAAITLSYAPGGHEHD